MVKIMQSLGLDYSPAISATELFQNSIKDLNQEMTFLKSTAIQSVQSISKAFQAEFGNVKVQDIKKIFDQIEKYNKPVEIKVTTDKAEIAMEKFARNMGIKLDKNLRNEFNKMASSFASGVDSRTFTHLAERISIAFAEAMEKERRKLTMQTLNETIEGQVYNHLKHVGQSGGLKLDYAGSQVKNEIDGFAESMRGLFGITDKGKISIEDLQTEMTGLGLVAEGNIETYDEFARYLKKMVDRYRELRDEGISMPLDDPIKREQYIRQELGELITQLHLIQQESIKTGQSLENIKSPIKDIGAVNKKTWEDASGDVYKYTETLKDLEKGLTVVDTYIKNADGQFNFAGRTINDKSLEVTYKEMQKVHAEALKMNEAFDATIAKNKQMAKDASWKQYFQNMTKTSDELKKMNKYYSDLEGNMNKQVKVSELAQMKVQAATIQQKSTAKGLSEEYTKQAGTLREQLSIIETKLQTEGKLSAEEVQKTQQLQEQLKILKSQMDTDIADQIVPVRSNVIADSAKFYAISKAAKEATSSIKDVEWGMVEIERVMDDSSFVFEQYRDNLFNLGVEYGHVFDTVQHVAKRWVQSGYNVADSLKLAETSLIALNAGELDAQYATEAMIGIMAQWELQADDLVTVMDKVNKTADNYSTTAQDLVDGLLRSSGAAKVMNLSLEDTISLLTVMREASGRTGREVGNALNSILSYIQRPKSIDVMESLGIQVFADEAQTQFRNALEIFQDIAANWDKTSKEIQDGFVAAADDAGLFNEELATALGMQEEWNDLQKRDISQAAAGVHRRNFFIGMIERMTEVQGVLNTMMDSEGYLMEKNAKAMETLEKQQMSLKASVEALAVAMGDAGLGNALKTLTIGGTKALNAFNEMPKGARDAILAFTEITLAVKALEAGMSLLSLKMPIMSAGLKVFTGGISNLTTNVMALGSAIKTGLIANLPLLGTAAVIGGVVALANHIKRAREEAQLFIATTQDNIQSLDEQKQGLTELAKEYDTLKSKENDLTITAEEKERLKEVQQELVELYDVSITGIDAEGNAYADSIEAIRARIDAIEDLKAAEQERLEAAVMAQDDSDVKTLEKNIEKRRQLVSEMKKIQEQIDEYRRIIDSGGMVTTPSGRGTIDASTEHGKSILRGYIDNLSKDYIELATILDDVNDKVSDSTNDRINLLKTDAAAMAKQLSDSGTQVSDSARVFANQLAEGLALTPKGIMEVRDEFENALKDFIRLDNQYKQAVSKGDTTAIDNASKAIMEFVAHITSGRPELDNFVISMEKLYPAADNLSESLANTNKSTINSEVAIGKATKAYEDATAKLQEYYVILDELNSKEGLSAKSKDAIITKYHELLPYISDEQELRKQLIQIIAMEEETQRKAYANMLLHSEKFYNTKIKGNAELATKLSEYYNIDLDNYKTLAQAKADVETALISTLSAKWQRYFNVTGNGIKATMDNLARAALHGDSAAAEMANELKDAHSKIINMEKEFQNIAIDVGGIDFTPINMSNVKTPKTKKGSKSKKDQRQFIDAIDAEIRAIKSRNDNLEETSELLKEQLNLAKNIEGLEGLNEQHRITGRIIENNKNLVQSYKKEQDELHKKANDIRNANKKYNIDSWFDANAEQTVAYINQYNRATKKQQENMDKIFNQMQKIKKAWMESNQEAKNLVSTTKELERELGNIALKQEELVRNKVKELIEAEKRNAYLDLERRQRIANDRLKAAKQEMEDEVKRKQDQIDRIQDEIDRIQESERARQERLERTKRLDEISKLEDRYHALQYKNIGDLTKEEAKSLELEQERTRYLERQAKIQELLIKLENTRREKNIQQLVKDKDGEWQFEYVADQKEIDDINKQIEDLQKEHSESLTDLKEKTLEDLKKAQEDYDEWERQNDIRRQIESKQRRIKQYQDEIKDLQDKYSKLEEITKEAFEREKENLDRFYTDIDLLTDEKMEELYKTFNGNWSNIHGMLTDYFRSIASEYEALIATLSQPLPDPGGVGGSGGGDYGYYEAPSGGTSFIRGGSGGSSNTDWSKIYMDARDKGDWRTMEHANRQANIERGLGDVVTSDRDIESIKRKYGYVSGGEITKTGWHWIDGEIGKPERVLSVQQTKDFNKFVTYIPDLLKSMQTTHDITANIQIPNLNRSQPIQTVYNHPNNGDTIYYINELTVPTDDFNKFIKDFTNAVDNHPNKTIMKVRKIGGI